MTVAGRGPGFRAKVGVARATGALSRRSGRGGGTTLPGRLLLRLAPDAIAASAPASTAGSTVISATNGKTTTAGMLAAAMRAAGRDPVHNRAGSNMSWGVATALLEQHGAEGLFEVDEAWLPRMAAELDPKLIVLGNLFRDQLDRYGELEHLADEWARMVARPLWRLRAERRRPAGRRPRPRRRSAPAVTGSPTSGSRTRRRRCRSSSTHSTPSTAAGAATRTRTRARSSAISATTRVPTAAPTGPSPQVSATAIELFGMRGSRSRVSTPDGEATLELPLPGLYNVYNALAALAAALRLGIGLEIAVEALSTVEAVFGRVETIAVGETPVSILLIKNPAGANEVLRTLHLEGRERHAGALDRAQRPHRRRSRRLLDLGR